MPISGCVVHVDPQSKERILQEFAQFHQVEVHGADDNGNVVTVLDTDTSEEMERLVKSLQQVDGVFSLGITFFDAEDEFEKVEQGIITPSFSFGRKGEKP